MKGLWFFVFVILVVGQATTSHAAEFKIIASDGTENDYFGYSVAISGDYAIVGALIDDDKGNNSGSAYLYHHSGTTWTEQAKLTASDGTQGDFFGISVAISGDYAIVGAYFNDDKGDASGSAYLFQRSRTTWAQQAKLTASDGSANDYFGYSVAISGDYAIVGAYQDDDQGSESGSAYLFQCSGTTWVQQAKLIASDGTPNDVFGISVAISGDYAIVGAFQDDDRGSESGSAYLFQRSGTTWVQQAKLTASDGAQGDSFGSSVAISGDYAIVGALFDDDKGTSSGSAYLFRRSGTMWVQQAKLTASDGTPNDVFGYSVAISGDYAIVGAFQDTDKGNSSGSVYSFLRSGSSWSQKAKVTASDGAAGDFFGYSVAISGNYTIVGAYFDDDKGTSSGSAYLYESIADFALPVELSAFSGTVTPDGVLMQWRTESEENNLGFHVYRSTAKEGQYVRITPTLIKGRGTTDTPHDYSFLDETAEGGKTYWYRIEAVDFGGVTERSDPIQVLPRRHVISPEVLPVQFALYQNYPNPFNPETWIPYDLAGSAAVTLAIYTAAGQRIRTLSLGNLPAGSYVTKDKAGYWDGRSDTGELVSSGIYFYHLQAGDFAATKPMLTLK